MKKLLSTLILLSIVHAISISAQDSLFIAEQKMIAIEVHYITDEEISFHEIGKEATFTLAINKIAHIYKAKTYSIYYLPSLAAKNHHLSRLNPGVELKINQKAQVLKEEGKKTATLPQQNGSVLPSVDQIKAEEERIKKQILLDIRNSRFQQNRIVLEATGGTIKGRLIDVNETGIIVISGRTIDDYHKISYSDIEKLKIRVMGKNRIVPGLVAATFGGIFTYYAAHMIFQEDVSSEEFRIVYLWNLPAKLTIFGSYIFGSRTNSKKYYYSISYSKEFYSDFVKSIEKRAIK